MLPYNPNLTPPARRLRKEMTDAEQLLWSRLRRKQILGLHFYRQKPLGNFIVDFYAPKANLVVEVDGSQHGDADHAGRDAERDEYLTARGLYVIRFSNAQVLREVGAVMEAIYRTVAGNPPFPPFSKGGLNRGHECQQIKPDPQAHRASGAGITYTSPCRSGPFAKQTSRGYHQAGGAAHVKALLRHASSGGRP